MSAFQTEWSFRLDLVNEDEADGSSSSAAAHHEICVPTHLREAFATAGFVAIGLRGDDKDTDRIHAHNGPVLSVAACAALNQRLEEILRGRYSRGVAPDKAPRRLKSEYEGSHHVATNAETELNDHATNERRRIKTRPHQSTIGPIGFSGNRHNVRVIQVINVHKADYLFAKLAYSSRLSQVVAQLAGWTTHGVRLASDQVWAKPPGAAPLAFHRDAPYFMFDPPDVVTVWLALDDMDAELGPLQYVRGSHVWGNGRVGTASQFFSSNRGVALLQSAASAASDPTVSGANPMHGQTGVDPVSEDEPSVTSTSDGWDIVSMAGLPAGALSIHNGLTWHGSDKNRSSSRPRRGLGLHFVPAHVKFTAEAVYSSLWRRYVQEAVTRNEDVSLVPVPECDFPITWQPTNAIPE